MTINTEQRGLARSLYDAHKQKKPITIHTVPGIIDKLNAYEIQQQLTDQKTSLDRDPLAGYKISLTNEETQTLFHTNAPLYGALTESNINNGEIILNHMNQPLIEVELMFKINDEITVNDDIPSILRKVSIAPGIEVPDSRFTDWFPHLDVHQVICDSAVAGNIIIGDLEEQLTYDQLANTQVTLYLNDEIIRKGSSTSVLGNPVNAIVWLAKELTEVGRTIEPGMVISTGTFIPPQQLQKGTYRAEFSTLGTVTLHVV